MYLDSKMEFYFLLWIATMVRHKSWSVIKHFISVTVLVSNLRVSNKSSILLLCIWKGCPDLCDHTGRERHSVVSSQPSPCPEHQIAICSIPVAAEMREKCETYCCVTVESVYYMMWIKINTLKIRSKSNVCMFSILIEICMCVRSL